MTPRIPKGGSVADIPRLWSVSLLISSPPFACRDLASGTLGIWKHRGRQKQPKKQCRNAATTDRSMSCSAKPFSQTRTARVMHGRGTMRPASLYGFDVVRGNPPSPRQDPPLINGIAL
eukprot:scaffold41_cov274-Pinguiococcus_pyrenoidosus.AAC.6